MLAARSLTQALSPTFEGGKRDVSSEMDLIRDAADNRGTADRESARSVTRTTKEDGKSLLGSGAVLSTGVRGARATSSIACEGPAS
jgi:hypothetical protein